MTEYEIHVRKQYESLEKYDIVSDDVKFRKHFDKWNFFDFEKELKIIEGSSVMLKSPGQIFLYEKFEQEGGIKKVSYPKLAVFLNYLPCDQTVEVEWFDFRRTWESNRKYKYLSKGEEREYYYMDSSSMIKSQPQWSDYLMIYGVWDKSPNWKGLKK